MLLILKRFWLKPIKKESRLKFVAQFENGKASVGLQFIPKDHPFIT
jgi:aspartokinase/homoserine dehydrogenase 1